MGRSVGGVSALIAGATAIGFLVSGCSSVTGPVIGVPNIAPTVSPITTPIDNAINQAIDAELAQASATQSDGEPPSVLAELNAITSVRGLVLAENFEALQATGASQISKREQFVNSLIADVQADTYLNGVDLRGLSVSRSLIAILVGVNSQLHALAAKIASDSLPDVLRSDILSIGASTRVYGVFAPMVHLVIAGGDELSELDALASQGSASVAAARATTDSAIETAMSLTASGYPGNKTTVTAVRSALIQLRSQLGQATADSTRTLNFSPNGE
jgi:hypothetical protein